MAINLVSAARATDPLVRSIVPANAFIGREHDVAAIRAQLLRGTRLLTLIGPPGVGKTRLAVEAATTLRGEFPDGIVIVSLADTQDPAHLPAAIADALGLPDLTTDGEDDLAAALADRHLLLVLDNFEHLLPAAPMVATLLKTCPRLAVLATSRAPLRLSTEHELPVHPLSLPPVVAATGTAPGTATHTEAIASAAAVQLFLHRAQLMQPHFQLTAENAAGIATLCQALDGLPLAIELAAPRVRVLSPDAIARHVTGQLALLSPGNRDAPARHQTLQAAIDWSHALLAPDAQRLFRRLAVFSGGFDVQAAAAMWEPASPGEPAESTDIAILDLLDTLAQQSLVAQAVDTSRLSLLELIRAYAQDRLRQAGEEEDVRWLHARYYAGLAVEAEPLLKSQAQSQWVKRLTREHPNLRAALGWLLERAKHDSPDESAAAVELGLRMAGSLWWFWHLSGHNAEGREWLRTFLDLPAAQAPTSFRAQALYGLGFLAWSSRFWAWDPETPDVASRCQEESLTLFRSLGDRRGEAYALWGLGLAQYGTDKRHQTKTLDEALTVFREVDDAWGIVKALEHLGNVSWSRGDLLETQRLWEEGNVVARELGEPQNLLSNLRQLGNLALRQKDLPVARAYFLESLAVLEASGLPSPRSITHMAMGELALEEGDASLAWSRFHQSFRAAQALGSRTYSANAILGLAAATWLAGDPHHALRLAGAAAAYGRATVARRTVLLADRAAPATHVPAVPAEMLTRFSKSLERYAVWFVRARDIVGEGRTRQLLEEGSRTRLEELTAVSTVPSRPELPSPARQPAGSQPTFARRALSPLTPREAETAALIAQGLTNREIASRLTITERTAMRHVEHILAKLRLRSRTEVAVWFVEKAGATSVPSPPAS